ncbi:S-layer homology domain-containing protein [Paenibacillus radicis (ex Xue et al. 2023)]|uniref:S-layer homology domain-containing protein n=1 Tax=Paenibacillus radicis (ex Xue et al. 2023) TaxID=2972489 RepID=A0ABT1YDK8_9BACL|nr:S-layer homology domain-containing protein [Paenibacillus radicis (ex Xue et al. 2023)]MCR8631269.1 S-layer homology domain-containing protein [Paenibacillus radicis (ex Xue et al. 2023)]
MKKILSSLLCFLLLTLTVLPFAFAATTTPETPAVKSAADFKDLKDLPQDEKAKFDELIRGGVFSGLSEDTFGLDAKMDRAQFAKVAAIIFALPLDNTLAKASFTDVNPDHWSFVYVEALKKAGLTNGYDSEGKTYNPSGVVSRQELAAFLVRGLGLDDAAKKAAPATDATVDDWAKGYVSLSLEKKILMKQDDGTFDGAASATRKMLANASYEAKKIFGSAGKTDPATPTTPGTTTPATPGTTTPSTPGTTTPATGTTPGSTTPGTTTPAPTTPAKTDSQWQVSAKGKKVLITSDQKKPSAPELSDDEKPAVARLQALGFEVTRISSTKIDASITAGYDLIVIGASTNSKYVKKKLKTIDIPVLYIKSISFGDADFSTVAENTTIPKQTKITIQKSDHPIASGIKGDVEVFLDPSYVAFGIPSSDGVIVASALGDPTKGVIITYEKGTKNVLGESITARTALYGVRTIGDIKNSGTDEFWKLMDSTAMWLIQKPGS